MSRSQLYIKAEFFLKKNVNLLDTLALLKYTVLLHNYLF